MGRGVQERGALWPPWLRGAQERGPVGRVAWSQAVTVVGLGHGQQRGSGPGRPLWPPVPRCPRLSHSRSPVPLPVGALAGPFP